MDHSRLSMPLGEAIFTQRSGCVFVTGKLRMPMPRAEAAETLRSWRRVQEIARALVPAGGVRPF